MTWRLLWKLLSYHPRLYALDALFQVLMLCFPLIPGLMIRAFFDALTGSTSLAMSAWHWLVLLLLVEIGNIVVEFLGDSITKTQQRFELSALLRRNLLAQLFAHPGSHPLMDSKGSLISTGEIISFFREDIDQIQNNVARISQLLGSSLFALIAFGILLSINVQITLSTLVLVIAMIGLLRWSQPRIKAARQQSRSDTQQVTGFLGELFNAFQAIKIANAESYVVDYFRQLNQKRQESMVKDELLIAILEACFTNLENLSTGFLLLIAAWSMQSTTGEVLTVGDFSLFIYYFTYMRGFISRVGEFQLLLRHSEVSFERMGSLVPDSEQECPAKVLVEHHSLYLPFFWIKPPQSLPELDHCQPVKTPFKALKASHLTYHYPNSDKGIRDINFRIERGTITVITGPIGSGKTTLLRVLLGLLTHESGSIFWNGEQVEDPASFMVPPHVAYTPQVPRLFSRSIRENLLLNLNASASDIQVAIHQAVFEQDLAQMPEGLETSIGSKGVRLSGGQIQRAAAARMFVRQPELLVFDDLSSALDVRTERILWERLLTRDDKPTCLLVSHRPEVLRRADQIILLEQGHLADRVLVR